MNAETWKPIPGFPDYEVSGLGRVRTLRGVDTPQVLKPKTDKGGYLIVVLYREGKEHPCRVHCPVHRLVLLAFVGPCPAGMETCHNNGNPADNRLCNLRWDTPKANQADRLKHGTDNRGSNHPSAKLSEVDVPIIRHYLAVGETPELLAAELRVSRDVIENIKRGYSWKHIPQDTPPVL